MAGPRVLAPGEVVLEDAWRSFSARGDRGRTLKEGITRLGRGGPPELPRTQALAGVSLRIAPGEVVGIIGRNGAGKTSTLRVLAGIIPLDRGFVGCGGRTAALIELGSGFGREFTGRENIFLAAALNGMSRGQIEGRIGTIIDFSELGHFIDAPIKTYSSGMLVRLGFSVAAHLDSQVLLIDEVLAVGDEAFQRKCLRLIRERIEQRTTVVLVSHAPATIERVCRRVIVLDHGRIAFDGDVGEGLQRYHRMLGLEGPEQAAARISRDGALTLRRAELLDGRERPRHVFAPGERLVLDLDWVLRPGGPAPRIELEVRTARHVTIFRTSREVGGAGEGRVRFEIPRLPLLDGEYELAVTVLEPGDTAPGIDRLLPFTVEGGGNAEGLVDLQGEWAEGARAVEAER